MIKFSPQNPVTAAIGDGANDVSMIEEADVGIGKTKLCQSVIFVCATRWVI